MVVGCVSVSRRITAERYISEWMGNTADNTCGPFSHNTCKQSCKLIYIFKILTELIHADHCFIDIFKGKHLLCFVCFSTGTHTTTQTTECVCVRAFVGVSFLEKQPLVHLSAFKDCKYTFFLLLFMSQSRAWLLKDPSVRITLWYRFFCTKLNRLLNRAWFVWRRSSNSGPFSLISPKPHLTTIIR